MQNIVQYFKPITTQYHILMHLRYIAVKNIARKGEIARNEQFLFFFHNVFYPTWYFFSILNAL